MRRIGEEMGKDGCGGKSSAGTELQHVNARI